MLVGSMKVRLSMLGPSFPHLTDCIVSHMLHPGECFLGLKPLHEAVMCGRIDIVEQLVKASADINASSENDLFRCTALHRSQKTRLDAFLTPIG